MSFDQRLPPTNSLLSCFGGLYAVNAAISLAINWLANWGCALLVNKDKKDEMFKKFSSAEILTCYVAAIIFALIFPYTVYPTVIKYIRRGKVAAVAGRKLERIPLINFVSVPSKSTRLQRHVLFSLIPASIMVLFLMLINCAPHGFAHFCGTSVLDYHAFSIYRASYVTVLCFVGYSTAWLAAHNDELPELQDAQPIISGTTENMDAPYGTVVGK